MSLSESDKFALDMEEFEDSLIDLLSDGARMDVLRAIARVTVLKAITAEYELMLAEAYDDVFSEALAEKSLHQAVTEEIRSKVRATIAVVDIEDENERTTRP